MKSSFEPALRCFFRFSEGVLSIFLAAAIAAAIAAIAAALIAPPAAKTAAIAAKAARAGAVGAAKTPVIAAAIAAATVAAFAPAAKVAARRARLHRPGLVHHQIAALQRFVVHAFNGGLRLGIAAHFHKAKAFGAARIALHHHLGAGYHAKRRESLAQIGITHGIRQIAHIKFVAHRRRSSKYKKQKKPGWSLPTPSKDKKKTPENVRFYRAARHYAPAYISNICAKRIIFTIAPPCVFTPCAAHRERLFLSVGIVALAEMGDKTRLLSRLLAARLRRPWPIALGIFAATLANHALAGALGLSFIMMAGWMTMPDQLDDDQRPAQNARRSAWGVFGATLAVFFLAEMGDKTQIATVALAARYPGAALSVVAGFTLGMMLANAPVVWLGDRLVRKAPLRAIQLACAAIFAALGLAALLG